MHLRSVSTAWLWIVLDADLIELASEEVTVFGIHDSLDGCTEYLDVVLLEDTTLVERYTAVESRLSTEGKEDPLRALLSMTFSMKKGVTGRK